MILTNDNYFSYRANWEYMSVSQFKAFQKCEAAAMAQLREEWQPEMTTALLVGSYVDAWFEGTLEEFKVKHPELFKRDGTLKADYIQAEEIIQRVQQDPVFMEYMAGQKQIIKTAHLFGCDWKIKIDSYFPGDKIVDLKVMRTMERIMGQSFVTHWGYDLQMAIYSAVEAASQGGGNRLETYLAVVTKEKPADLDIIHIPAWRRNELLEEVNQRMPRILAVKSGEKEPRRCGTCAYCRATKKLKEPIDFELVGFSEDEKAAIEGVIL